MAAKNPCAKARKEAQPYEVWVSKDGTWKWRVLKKYQSPEAEAKNQFARWYCAVTSPFTQGGSDLGDVYAKDVKSRAVLVEVDGKPVSPEVRAAIAIMGEKPDPLPPVGVEA